MTQDTEDPDMVELPAKGLIEGLQLAALKAPDIASLCLEGAEWMNCAVSAIERLLRVIGDEEDDWDAAEQEARYLLAKIGGDA